MQVGRNSGAQAVYPTSLGAFASRYNRVLIKRTKGGIGDVLNHRRIFQDLKAALPGAEITCAVPREFWSMLWHHPFIDKPEPLDRVNESEYAFVYDTTDRCGRYEFATMPRVDKHRSDIWAEGMGLTLTHHEGFVGFDSGERERARKLVDDVSGGKRKVLVATKTAGAHKDWPPERWQEVISAVATSGYTVYSANKLRTSYADCVNLEQMDLRTWLACVDRADYVLTLATATFVAADLLHKPTVAIFGCEDLRVYGKYHSALVPVQRRESGREWIGCPCWRGHCQHADQSTERMQCLDSIQPAEVLAAFAQLVAMPEPEYYDRAYFEAGGCKGWYDETAFARDNKFHRARAQDVVDSLGLDRKRPVKVLDIGTARGNLPFWLCQLGQDGYGLDVSRWAVEHSHLEPSRIRQGSIANCSIPYEPGTFDALVSREVLEHIPESEVPQAMANMARLLRPGGWQMHWIATDRGGKQTRKEHDPRNYDGSHVCVKPPQWWVGKFSEAGMALDAGRTLAAMHRESAVRFNWDVLILRKGGDR